MGLFEARLGPSRDFLGRWAECGRGIRGGHRGETPSCPSARGYAKGLRRLSSSATGAHGKLSWASGGYSFREPCHVAYVELRMRPNKTV